METIQSSNLETKADDVHVCARVCVRRVSVCVSARVCVCVSVRACVCVRA